VIPALVPKYNSILRLFLVSLHMSKFLTSFTSCFSFFLALYIFAGLFSRFRPDMFEVSILFVVISLRRHSCDMLVSITVFVIYKYLRGVRARCM
jgi:hypothetical protein